MENKKSPLTMFFELGNKVTKGDPIRKAEFDYSFMWILFLSFVTLCIRNWFYFFMTWEINYIAWGFVTMAIAWFQYFGLGAFYHNMKNMKAMYKDKPQIIEDKELKEDPINEMLGEFENGR